MIIYQICHLLPFFPYLPVLLMDLHDDVGCSQTGHVGSGFGTCRRARGARRIVSACARLFILCLLPSFFRLCVWPAPHYKQSPEDDHFSLCFARDSPYYPPLFPVSFSQTLADVIRFHFFYRKIVELEEELRVVGNNLKSLEVSEEKVFHSLSRHIPFILNQQNFQTFYLSI